MDNRNHLRHTPATLTYVSAGEGNGGILLNLSEQGCSLQLISPPHANTQLEMEIELDAGVRIQANGTIMWVDQSGCVGVRFDHMPDNGRTLLRHWLSTATPPPVSDEELTELDTILDLGSDAPVGGGGSAPAEEFLFDSAPETEEAGVAVAAGYQTFAARLTELSSAAAYMAIAEECCARSGATACAIAVLAEREMICRASAGTGAPPAGARLDITSDRSFTAQSVKQGKTLRCRDTASDVRVNAAVCERLGIRSVAAVPLLVQGRVVGLLEVFSAQRDAFKEQVLPTLEELAQVAADFSLNRGEVKHGAGVLPAAAESDSAVDFGMATPSEKASPQVVAPVIATVPVIPAIPIRPAFAPVAAAPGLAPQKPAASPTSFASARPAEPKPQTASAAAPLPSTPAWAPAIPQSSPKTLEITRYETRAAAAPSRAPEPEVQPMAAAVDAFPREATLKPARRSAASAAEIALPSFVSPAKPAGNMPLMIGTAVVLVAALSFGGWKWSHSIAAKKAASAAAVQAAAVQAPPALVAAQPATAPPPIVVTKPTSTPKPGTTTAQPATPAKPEKIEKPKATKEPETIMALNAGGTPRPQIDTQDVAPPIVNVGGNGSMPSLLTTMHTVIPGKPVQVSTGAQEGRLIHRVEPHYPEIAKRSGRGGTVRLSVLVGMDGKVKKVKVVDGSPVLAAAAQDAVSQWRYRPFMLDGKPTEVETEVTVKFENPR